MICANAPQRPTTTGSGVTTRGPAARRESPGMPVLCTLLAALSGTAVATPHDGAVFAEPTTGKPVSRYTVELAANGEQRQTFDIPRDCPEVKQVLEERRADTTRVVDRRLWGKVSEDCWFHAFLNRHPFRGIEDFVTDYDFRNARVADLPIDLDCVGDGANGEAAGCGPGTGNRHGLLRHFPLSVPADAVLDHAASGDCLLRDGVFFGRLYIGPDGPHCDSRHAEPSLRLIAVDYADINGDGFLDAVLRFAPIGPGVARSPLILPLTRTRPDGPFVVPDGM